MSGAAAAGAAGAALHLVFQSGIHEHVVRSVCALDDGRFASGGYDGVIIVWRPTDSGYDVDRLLSGHSKAVSSLFFDAPRRRLLSASYDCTVREWPLQTAGAEPRVLCTHDREAIAVVAAPNGDVVSAGWDCSARRVDSATLHVVGRWDVKVALLSLCVLPDGAVCAGAQEGSVFVLRPGGQTQALTSHLKAVQSLAPRPTGFVSVSNDGRVGVWSGVDGAVSCEKLFRISDTFLYNVNRIDDTTYAVCTEDRLLALYSLATGELVESVTHPRELWGSATLPNGDVVTACADKIVRVFSRDPARIAPAEALEEFRAAVKSAAVHSDQVAPGTVVGPARLEQPGDFQGQIIVVQESNSMKGAKMYAWDEAARDWSMVGEVTDAPPSGGVPDANNHGSRVHGVEYDYVFDVDLNGARMKLGFNKGENPFFAAQRFLDQNQLDQDFLSEIADWVMAHVDKTELAGVSIGPGGAARQTSAQAPPARPSHQPAAAAAAPGTGAVQAVTSRGTNFDAARCLGMLRKVNEFLRKSAPALSCTESELGVVERTFKILARPMFFDVNPLESNAVAIMVKMLHWPCDSTSPDFKTMRGFVLDAARLLALHPQCSPQQFAALRAVVEQTLDSVRSGNLPCVRNGIQVLCNALSHASAGPAVVPLVAKTLDATADLLASDSRDQLPSVFVNAALVLARTSGGVELAVQLASQISELLPRLATDVALLGCVEALVALAQNVAYRPLLAQQVDVGALAAALVNPSPALSARVAELRALFAGAAN